MGSVANCPKHIHKSDYSNMEITSELYNSMTQAQRQAILNDCNNQFTDTFAERESNKTWNQLPIFVQNTILKIHRSK
jgi:hypothetical protein